LALALPLRPSGFPLRSLGSSQHRRPRRFYATVHPPRGFGPPPEYDGTSPLPLPRRAGSSSHEVQCLTAPSAFQVRSTRRVPTHRRLPPSGFHNLSTASTLNALRACFIPLARRGFSLQGFPIPGSRILSRGPLPSCRYQRSSFSLRRRAAVGPASGPCSPWKSVAAWRAFNPSGARCPPGLSPLQGSHVLRPWSTLPSTSPHELPSESVRDVLFRAPQGLPAPKARYVSRETTDPLEVCDLVGPLTRLKVRPDLAYRFTEDGIRCRQQTAPPP